MSKFSPSDLFIKLLRSSLEKLCHHGLVAFCAEFSSVIVDMYCEGIAAGNSFCSSLADGAITAQPVNENSNIQCSNMWQSGIVLSSDLS